MPVFFIRAFTAVPGDAAYIEAETARGAAERLAERLEQGGLSEDCAPRAKWEITEMHSPICVIVWCD